MVESMLKFNVPVASRPHIESQTKSAFLKIYETKKCWSCLITDKGGFVEGVEDSRQRQSEAEVSRHDPSTLIAGSF